MMAIEQIISLIRLCGWLLMIPALICLTGGLITALRLRSGGAADAAVDTPSTIQEGTGEQPGNKSGQSRSKRKFSKKKPPSTEPVSVETAHQPIVRVYVPESAKAVLGELWAGFPPMPEGWQHLYSKEDHT